MPNIAPAADPLTDAVWNWLLEEEARLAAQVKLYADAGDRVNEMKATGSLSIVCEAIQLLEAGY